MHPGSLQSLKVQRCRNGIKLGAFTQQRSVVRIVAATVTSWAILTLHHLARFTEFLLSKKLLQILQLVS